MRLYQRRILPIVALLLLLAPTTGCNDDQLKKAAKTAATIADLIQATADVRDALLSQGLIDNQEALALTKSLADLNLVNQEFNAQVLETKQSGVFDQEARIKLRVLLGNVIGSIDRLNQQGVLTLHNEEAQRRMSLAVRSIQVAVNLVWEVLER